MLDLLPLVGDIKEAGRREKQRRDRIGKAVALAASVSRMATETWQSDHVERLRVADSKRLFAHANEPPSIAVDLPVLPTQFHVVAVDGSQIVPDRHNGVASCWLLNVGNVVLTYGNPSRARLFSTSKIEMLDGDDEDAERAAIQSLAVRRYGREVKQLADLAVETQSANNLPTVALTDGSLVAWILDDKTGEDVAKRDALNELLTALRTSEKNRIPFVGYISEPGFREVICSLSVILCEDHPTVCRDCRKSAEDADCHLVHSANDAALFAELLTPGQRSPIFSSHDQRSGQSHILQKFGSEQWICFFYLNVGREIARVEFPCWVAAETELVDRVHAVVYDQARKGQGYPVALCEAHEQAVVRGSDREAFLNLLQRATIHEGALAQTTRKALSKRTRPL